jgi:hypothetical protein
LIYSNGEPRTDAVLCVVVIDLICRCLPKRTTGSFFLGLDGVAIITGLAECFGGYGQAPPRVRSPTVAVESEVPGSMEDFVDSRCCL